MNKSLPRRRLLQSVTAISIGGLSGCLSTFRQSPAEIYEVIIINMDDVSHTIKLQIVSSEETVFQDTIIIPPRSETQPVISQDDGLPSTADQYTVRAVLIENDDSIQRTIPQEAGGDCYSVTIQIDSDGTFRNMPTDSTLDECEE